MKELANSRNHKYYFVFCIVFIVSAIIIELNTAVDLLVFIISFSSILIVGFMRLWFTVSVERISYDKQNFYIQMRDVEIIIPLEDTRGIGNQTLDGVFELELVNPSQVGDKIWFKPSLFYPFTANHVDKEIAQINAQIKRLKRNRIAPQAKGKNLQSFN